jgi:hypothetical protein
MFLGVAKSGLSRFLVFAGLFRGFLFCGWFVVCCASERFFALCAPHV